MSLSSGDAAEEVVRLALSGADITLRLVASATKNLGAMVLALRKGHKKLSGKTNMHKMLKQTREIQAITMTPKQYKAFKKKSRKYKILYATVKDKTDKTKSVDVLMPVTELSRANRLFERIGINDSPSPAQSEKTKEKEEKSKNAHRSEPASRDTKSKPASSRQNSTTPKAPQTMNNQKPSVEAKLEGYRQQQSATRGPTKTQRKRRGAKMEIPR